MLKTLILISLILVLNSNSALAAGPSLARLQMIASSMNGLLDDTYNEGEGFAEVAKIDGEPDIRCQISNQSVTQITYLCDITIDVTQDASNPESDKGQRVCVGLQYRVIAGKKHAEFLNLHPVWNDCVGGLDDSY